MIVDNVGARLTQSPGYVLMPFTVSNIYAINAAENILSITTLGDSVVIDTVGTTGITYPVNLNNLISVFPNPAKDKVIIRGGSLQLQQIELINTLGESVSSITPDASIVSLDLSNVQSGIYVLRITSLLVFES